VAKGNRVNGGKGGKEKARVGGVGGCAPASPLFLFNSPGSSFGFLSASSRHYRKTVQTKEEECDGAGSVNLPFYVVKAKEELKKGCSSRGWYDIRTFARARLVLRAHIR
jgi:hypothetical protein